MSGKKWEKANNRKQSGRFFGMPINVMASPNYIRLSAHAVKLLNDLGFQYHGKNNGDLCATWTMMKKRGWKSQDTLNKALKELVHYGMIIKSRQGGRHRPNLYALSWQSVDECKGRLDINPTIAPPGNWMIVADDFAGG